MAAEVDAGQGGDLSVEDAVRRIVADEEKLFGGIGEVDLLPGDLELARFKAIEPKGGEGGRIAVVEEDNIRICA